MAYSIYSLGVEREWPCRLLHIPSMTSLEWRPGNFYGQDKDPSYAILSYTWGRFEKPGEPRLQIDGIDWELPSTDPGHFAVADLRRLLRLIGSTHDYLWIDIACIDQKREELKMREVGRQAAIFKGARKAYVWLNKYEPDIMRGHMQTLLQRAYSFASGEVEPLDAAETIIESLSLLLEDPWFSSLWTLQESVLQRHAVLLDKTGEPIITNGPWTGESPVTQLLDISGACAVARTAIDQGIGAELAADYVADPGLPTTRMQSLRSVIHRSGIDFLLCPNPNIQYSAANFRQTSRPEDRIYAIMQVYGYKLGNSAESSRKNRKFSLADLEIQFLRTLTCRFPLLSQAFQHLGIPRPGQSWYITNQIRVPERLHFIIANEQFLTSACEIAVHRSNKAYFEGIACSVRDLFQFLDLRSREMLIDLETTTDAPDELRERREFFNPNYSRDYHFKQAKQGLIMDQSSDYDSEAMSFEWPPDTTLIDERAELIIENRVPQLRETREKQKSIVESLMVRYGEEGLKVLYLGRAAHIERMDVALVLLQISKYRSPIFPKKTRWKRIGLCFWNVEGGHADDIGNSLRPLRGKIY